MDELTFGEILIHYQLRLKEYIEDMGELQKLLVVSEKARSAWIGRTSDKVGDKIEQVTKETNILINELQDAVKCLTEIVPERTMSEQ